MISLRDTPADRALEYALEQYRQPVTITHDLFGELTLNRSVDWFEGKGNWLNHPVDISFSLDGDESPAAAIETAVSLWENMSYWNEQVNDYAVLQLLQLKNDNWLGEGQTPLSAGDFLQAISLESISFYPDGEFEFWYDDGDLFWGHSVLISGSLIDGLKDADIPG